MQHHIDNWERWKTACAEVLRNNMPEAEVLAQLPYRYTCPAKEMGAYLPQWLWDSCFHAMTYRWFDPDMAWSELQSLFVHQVRTGPDEGMVPHMAHLKENGAGADQELFGQQDRSIFTQPPLIATAALSVYEKSPDREVLERLFPKLVAYHRWFDKRRDPDNDDLVAIIHPWESGWDASQRWDRSMGFIDGAAGPAVAAASGSASGPDSSSGPPATPTPTPTPIGAAASGPLRTLSDKRKTLADSVVKQRGDAQLLADLNSFYVEPADFNAIRAADLEALSRIAAILEQPEATVASLTRQADRIRRAVREKMTETHDGRLRVYDLLGAREDKSPQESAAKFVLMFGKCATEDQARLLRDELEDLTGSFTTPYRVSTTPTNDPHFDGREYWRGNVWLSVNWLIYIGLRNYGFHEEARRLAANSLELVERNGFCEFFDPLTGEGGARLGKACPRNYGWSTIVLDMLGDHLSAP